jgi:hypothetical protein
MQNKLSRNKINVVHGKNDLFSIIYFDSKDVLKIATYCNKTQLLHV